MCKGMNRSFISVILGGFGGEVAGPAAGKEQRPVKIGSAGDAAYIMKNASKGIGVPRSEERRGGEEGRSRGSPDHLKKKKKDKDSRTEGSGCVRRDGRVQHAG